MLRWMWPLAGMWILAFALSASMLRMTHSVRPPLTAAGHSEAKPVVALRKADRSRETVRRIDHRTAPEAAVSAAAPLDDAAPLPALVLVGTMADPDPSKSSAWFLVGQEQQFHAVGDAVGGRRLVTVARGHVRLAGPGGEERLDLEAGQSAAPALPAAPSLADATWQPVTEQVFLASGPIAADETDRIKQAITAISDTERVVNRAAVWEAVSGNPLQVMREATMLPAFKDGRFAGVALHSMPEDGILRQSGFRPGDVIEAVNGEPVTNPAMVLELPERLAQAAQISVRIERDGHPQTLTYQLR